MSDSTMKPNKPAPLVEARGLTRFFDVGRGRRVHAVDNVSLTVGEREIVGLVGESGSGKSTFGKTLLGLHDKTAGEVLFRGETLPARYRSVDYQRLAGNMQMIFQDPYSSLNPRMTVGEIVAEGLRLHAGVSNAMARERVAEWLGRVGLQPDHMSRYPHEFSGGQRQRIGIARALILEPDFVVCDEPISALDVSVQAQVINLLGELKESMGLTLLFIAHDLSMVRYVSDRMAVMYLGSLVEIGRADALYFDPKHPYTAALFASVPTVGTGKRRFEAIKGEIPSPINPPSGCAFHPRCPHAGPRCRVEAPRLTEAGQGRTVACHLNDGGVEVAA